MNDEDLYYFAYGSNMNVDRINERCPGNIPLGKATLKNYRVTERKFADIDYDETSEIEGVVYKITKEHLKTLDEREGYPNIYTRYEVEVLLDDKPLTAIVYEMTKETKVERDGIKYNAFYKNLCSTGAQHYGVKNNFI